MRSTPALVSALSRGLTPALALAALAAVATTAPVAQAQDLSAAGGKVAVCITCHGATGSSENPLYPHIAGQTASYLVKSMKEYRDGTRRDPLMAAMAVGLTDGEIQELAAYYANQKPRPNRQPAMDVAAGGGKLPVCTACHTATGKSDIAIYPHIAGQHIQYMIKTMKEYRDGIRQDPLMSPMAVGLTDEEIQQLAIYYASQQP